MTIITRTDETRNSPHPATEIRYSAATHMFDVLYCGEKIAEEACYGDGEASLLIYIALREAEEAAADSAYRRHACARYLLDTYPEAVYLNWREVFLMDPPRPILAPQIIVTRPNGYTVHTNLNAGLGSVIDTVNFTVLL